MFDFLKNEIKEYVPPDLDAIIDEAIVKHRKENKHIGTPFYFNPSGLGNIGCLRKMQYTFFKYAFKDADEIIEKSEDNMFTKNTRKAAKLSRIFANGNDVHDRYEKYFEWAGILTKSEEVLLDNDIRVKGRLDDLINIDGRDYIVEIKSMNSIPYSKLTKPKKEHILQLTLYMHIKGIHEGYLTYEGKNDQEHRSFYITYDPKVLKYLFDTIDSILKTSKEHKLMPEKLQSCSSCPFYKYCKAGKLPEELIKFEIDWDDFSEIKR